MRAFQVSRCALLGAALAGFVVASPAPATAAVYSQQQALSAPVIQDFLANPGALLTKYPVGGAQLISRVRDLAASDPSTLNPIVGLLATANANQSTAIGTGLGQVAMMAVKTDQAYANQIQEVIASAIKGHDVGPVLLATGVAGVGSSQLKIGNAVKTIDKVDGVTERGEQPVIVGSEVFAQELLRTGPSAKAELLFADRSNLAVGPVSTIRLDKFVYDPSGGSGNVVLEVNKGTFRFISGVQDPRNYEIKTPVAIVGVRGTEFIVVVEPDGGEKIQLLKGEVIVTTKSGEVVHIKDPCKILLVDPQGNPKDGGCVSQPLADFSDLGPPTTNTSLADALAAFNAVTGGVATGATGGEAGGGTGGGGVTGGSSGTIGGFGSFGGTPTFTTTVVSPPITTTTITLTTPITTTTIPLTTPSAPVSRH